MLLGNDKKFGKMLERLQKEMIECDIKDKIITYDSINVHIQMKDKYMWHIKTFE